MMWKILFVAVFAVGTLADIPTIGDVESRRAEFKRMLTEECKKNGADDAAVQGVEDAAKNAFQCVQGLIKFDDLQNEIDLARPQGALDEVFKKYCDKKSDFKNCYNGLLTSLEPCMDAEQKGHVNDLKNGISNLLDFVCHKDGDRIALFISEGGPECIRGKAEEISQCGTTMHRSVSTVEAAKELKKHEVCAKYDEFTACVVKALESCSTPTPANMIESLLKYIRKSSPCLDVQLSPSN